MNIKNNSTTKTIFGGERVRKNPLDEQRTMLWMTVYCVSIAEKGAKEVSHSWKVLEALFITFFPVSHAPGALVSILPARALLEGGISTCSSHGSWRPLSIPVSIYHSLKQQRTWLYSSASCGLFCAPGWAHTHPQCLCPWAVQAGKGRVVPVSSREPRPGVAWALFWSAAV